MSDVFNWRLPPAPGYPGYQPPPQAPQPRPATQPPTQTGYHQPVGPIQPPPTSVDAGAGGGGGGGGPDDGGEPYEPYIPSRADRPYSQWGTPDFALQGAINAPGMARGPLMPQMRDIAGLIHAATMGLGRYGSRYTGMPAIAMGTYASAYWNAYQKGMHQRASDAYQQYRMARQMTIDRGKEEMKDYATIYATYFKDGKITDEEGFKNDLLQAATKYHNQPLINQIRAGNLGAAERILQMTDAQIANLIKGQHQEDRAKQADEERKLRMDALRTQERLRLEKEKAEAEKRKALEDARKRIDPNATGPGPGYTPPTDDDIGSTPPPEPATPPDAATPPDTPPDDASTEPDVPPPDTAGLEPPDETSQKPIQVADASGQVPIGGGQPVAPSKAVGFDKFGPEGKEETPVLENAAKNWVFTHKLPASIDKKTMPDLAARAEARGGELENYLNKLAADPKTSSDQMKREVRRLFPGFANTIDKAINGDIPPPRSIGASNQAYWNMLYNIGAKIDPSFTADTFAERAKARIFWTSGPGGNKLTSVGTAFKHLQDLRELAMQGKKPMQLTSGFSEWWATHFGEIGEFSNTLNTAIHEYENALAASGASGGGSATIPALKDATKELTINQSDKNFIDNIDSKIKLLGERLEQLHGQYRTSTGRPAEEIDRRFEEFAKTAAPSYKNIDPKFSDDLYNAPDRLRAIRNYKGGTQDNAKEGDRKQFKQGWGVFRNGKWVPEQ